MFLELIAKILVYVRVGIEDLDSRDGMAIRRVAYPIEKRFYREWSHRTIDCYEVAFLTEFLKLHEPVVVNNNVWMLMERNELLYSYPPKRGVDAIETSTKYVQKATTTLAVAGY